MKRASMAVQMDTSPPTASAADKVNRLSKWLLWLSILSALFVVVVYPLIWLGIGSFQTPMGEWTFRNYQEVFTPYYLELLWNSIVFTVLATVIALAIGIPMAWAVARTDIPFKGFLRGASAVTFVLPPLLQAMAFVIMFQPNAGLVNSLLHDLFGVRPFDIYTFTGLVLVTALGVYPQSFLLVDSALRTMDPSLEEAATSVGAKRSRIIYKITLPLVLPAILTAANLTAIHNLVVFGPPAVIGIPGRIYVMATQIYIELSAFPPRLEFTASLAILFLTVAVMLLTFQTVMLQKRNYSTIVGKGMRPREIELKKWKWPVFGLCCLVVFVALILPVLVLGGLSFAKVWTSWFAPGNLTLDNYYKVLFVHDRTISSFRNTILLALATVATTLAAGLVISYIIVKTRHRIGRVLNYVGFLPYSIPGAIFTVGVILAFIRPPFVLYGTLGILLVCYFARFLPFAVQPLSAALRQIDDSLLEAGRVTGAKWLTIMRLIALPLLKFSILSTVLLVFVACAREVVSAILLASPNTETVMVVAYRLWEEGLVQETSALMMLLLAVVLVFFLIARGIIGNKMFD